MVRKNSVAGNCGGACANATAEFDPALRIAEPSKPVSNPNLRSDMLSGKQWEMSMIKVMWFLKRADHLSLEDFHRWWMETHVPAIVEAQKPHRKSMLSIYAGRDDPLPGKPLNEMDWDGIAEQWFDTEEAFNAVYGSTTVSAARADTLKHVSRHARMIVRENPIQVRNT